MTNFCIISAQHDYRSPRRANIHFIAEELAKHGIVQFFSCRFSALSRFKYADPRSGLVGRANRVERHEGVDSYLWRPAVHPIALPALLRGLERRLFKLYVEAAPQVLRDWIEAADVVLIESGISILFYGLVRQINPRATIVYSVSDDLETIRAAGTAREYLASVAGEIDLIRVASRSAVGTFPKRNVFFVPHGVDKLAVQAPNASPYQRGTVNAISVGSMLFDGRAIDMAATMFPDIQFHIIGSGRVLRTSSRHNVIYYPEMPFAQTIPYLQHAAIGIAPYRQDRTASHIAETSLKLTQFGHIGLPAVCPREAVGSSRIRFGYDIRDPGTIRTAVEAALASPHVPDEAWSWAEATDRILAELKRRGLLNGTSG